MQDKGSVNGIIFNAQKNKILLIKRRDVPVWVLPGGGIEPEESAEEAIIREILEETGLSVGITRHVAIYTPINRLAKLTYLFECHVVSGTPSKGAETRDIGFFSHGQLT